MAGLKEGVDDLLGLTPPIEDWLQEEAVEQDVIIERLQAMTDEAMAAKTSGADMDRWIEVEKQILIQTLDHHWKEHLATIEALRTVIHLRSFAQKKPIDEYKQEAFALSSGCGAIREEVTKTRLREFQFTPSPRPGSARLHPTISTRCRARRHFDVMVLVEWGAMFAPVQLAAAADARGRGRPSSRNAPCRAGRAKYKHCHGALA